DTLPWSIPDAPAPSRIMRAASRHLWARLRPGSRLVGRSRCAAPACVGRGAGSPQARAEGWSPLPAAPLRALAIALFAGEPMRPPRAARIAAQLQRRLVRVIERRRVGGSRVMVLGRWRLRAWRRTVSRRTRARRGRRWRAGRRAVGGRRPMAWGVLGARLRR